MYFKLYCLVQMNEHPLGSTHQSSELPVTVLNLFTEVRLKNRYKIFNQSKSQG
jgi:hypothetical protein